MADSNSTQQRFDRSSFRKEIEARLQRRREDFDYASLRGDLQEECLAESATDELEWVLALLPGEEETP